VTFAGLAAVIATLLAAKTICSCQDLYLLLSSACTKVQVVALRTDVLIRALGPMAGLLQMALASAPQTPSLSDTTVSPDHEWSANGSLAALSNPGSAFQGPPDSAPNATCRTLPHLHSIR
jgi:hypothetical protein